MLRQIHMLKENSSCSKNGLGLASSLLSSPTYFYLFVLLSGDFDHFILKGKGPYLGPMLNGQSIFCTLLPTSESSWLI